MKTNAINIFFLLLQRNLLSTENTTTPPVKSASNVRVWSSLAKINFKPFFLNMQMTNIKICIQRKPIWRKSYRLSLEKVLVHGFLSGTGLKLCLQPLDHSRLCRFVDHLNATVGGAPVVWTGMQPEHPSRRVVKKRVCVAPHKRLPVSHDPQVLRSAPRDGVP